MSKYLGNFLLVAWRYIKYASMNFGLFIATYQVVSRFDRVLFTHYRNYLIEGI